MQALVLTILGYCLGGLFARHVHHAPWEQLPWAGGKLDKPEMAVCRSEACFKAARNFRESVNTSADPCDNFYAFACGKWIKNNPPSASFGHWNKFDMLNDKATHQLRELLEEPDFFDDSDAVKKVKTVYRACMNQERSEERGLNPLIQLLNHMEGWPMAGWSLSQEPWYLLLIKPMRLLDVEPIFDIDVSSDMKNTTRRVLRISEPSFGLPQFLLTEKKMNLTAYKKYITRSAALISAEYGHDLPRGAFAMETDSLIRFETRLARISAKQEAIRTEEKQHQTLTIGRLQELTNSVPVLNHDVKVNWRTFLTLLTKTAIPSDYFTNDTEISIAGFGFIRDILLLIDATPKRVVVNYIQWRVVMALCEHLNLDMRNIRYDFFMQTQSINRDPRWKDCINYASYLRFGLGYIYIKNHFSLYGKEKAISMVSEIRNAFRLELAEISWMDEATKKAALEKADFVLLMIGYPQWFSNVSNVDDYYGGLFVDNNHFENIIRINEFLVQRELKTLLKANDRGEWITDPITANAYYDPEHNTIMFPAGILRLPFFSDQQPESLNYGGIGAIIGHEISHAFDETGRQRDKLGNVRQWWSKKTEEAYSKKSTCFVDQYQKYRVPALDSYLDKPVTVNGVSTLNENVADNGGLRAAYRAYKADADRRGGQEPRLPGLEHITPDQLFFLSFATVWCESTTDSSMLNEVLSDPHSPHHYRVHGTLSNTPEFAAAWHCPVGSQMNPLEKCQLW